MMNINEDVIEKIAIDVGISPPELTAAGLLALLREMKRKIMVERLDILARYNVVSTEEIEEKVKNTEIPEHPAWEDLILVENLEASIAAIDGDIKAIQKHS